MASFDLGQIPRILPKIETGQMVAASLIDKAADIGLSLVVAIIILVVTFRLASWLSNWAGKALDRVQARRGGDTALHAFVTSAVRYLVIIIGLIAMLQQLGVKTTSIIAVLGAASLAIGLAMQGALSNVAAGVMLLILRPYRAGDLVEVGNVKGKVRGLDLFTTELSTLDGLKVIMPNGKVFGEMIINYSAPDARRVEIVVGIDYGDDIDHALQVMVDTATADPRVLAEPGPWARCADLADSSVNLVLRVWVEEPDYLEVRHDLIKRVKQAFDANGVNIPYPHQVNVEKNPAKPAEAEPEAPEKPKARKPPAPKSGG